MGSGDSQASLATWYGWNLDWYANYANPCVNCSDIQSSSYRVIRGGGFNTVASYLRAAIRYYNPRANHYYYVGAGCARTP